MTKRLNAVITLHQVEKSSSSQVGLLEQQSVLFEAAQIIVMDYVVSKKTHQLEVEAQNDSETRP